MFDVINNNIRLTRGDTFVSKVLMWKNGEAYEPEEGDVVRFALKKTREDETPLLSIVVPNDTMKLRIESEETKGIPFGTYIYDIELTMADGTVDTFVSGLFDITTEVN